MPLAFCDADTGTYVDCTLAFYARDPVAGTALGVDPGGAAALTVPPDGRRRGGDAGAQPVEVDAHRPRR